MVVMDLKALYGETARLALLPEWLEKALQLVGERDYVLNHNGTKKARG